MGMRCFYRITNESVIAKASLRAQRSNPLSLRGDLSLRGRRPKQSPYKPRAAGSASPPCLHNVGYGRPVARGLVFTGDISRSNGAGIGEIDDELELGTVGTRREKRYSPCSFVVLVWLFGRLNISQVIALQYAHVCTHGLKCFDKNFISSYFKFNGRSRRKTYFVHDGFRQCNESIMLNCCCFQHGFISLFLTDTDNYISKLPPC